MHDFATTPPIPRLSPSLLKCPSDLGGADEIRLPSSRGSHVDPGPLGSSNSLNGTRMGGFYNDLDPNEIVGYEDYGLLDEVLPVPSQKSHHVKDSYAQDPDDFVCRI